MIEAAMKAIVRLPSVGGSAKVQRLAVRRSLLSDAARFQYLERELIMEDRI